MRLTCAIFYTGPASVKDRANAAAAFPLEPLLDEIGGDARFEFWRQIVGYYYHVEVWRYGGMDVVFEEAD